MAGTGPMTETAGSMSPRPADCPVCHLPIATAAKLSGLHACPFCRKTFKRVDGARRHTKSCHRRGNQPLPADAKRGRKLRACDRCSRVKSQCDGKLPCSHCKARKLECTFERFCSDESHRERAAEAQVVSTQQSQLLFFLKFTGPRGGQAIEQEMAAVPEVDIQGPFTNKPPESNLETEFGDCIDPSLLFTTLLDPCFDMDPMKAGPADVFEYSEYNASGGLTMTSPTDSLAVRIAHLSKDLSQVASLNSELSCFDPLSFKEVFSSDQVHAFCEAFSRKRHYQYPVVHWPTFNLETTCLPLLLAISLNGAAYSKSSSDAAGSRARARDFYLIADAYIFQQLERSINSNHQEPESETTVEILQAALLIVVLQICFDDSRKGVIIFKRLPLLVFSLRHFGLTRMKHDEAENWRTFIKQETRIRLSTWTFFMDSLLTLFCNNPPSMSHAETLGHLPCSQALWDAGSEGAFIQLRLDTVHEFVCLGDLTVGLMQNEWPIEPVPPFDRLTLHHLNAVIVALQPIIFNLHTFSLHDTGRINWLRALDRWTTLWNAATRPKQPGSLGVERNSPGLALLSRKIIEVTGIDTAGQCEYLKRVPKHDFSDLHRFIREYC
ncbi:transcription factor [Colletotrichum asianum]